MADAPGSDELLRALEALVSQLSPAERRRLLIDLSSRVSRAAGGLRLVLASDALLACAEHGGDFGTPLGYERWRAHRPRPDEYPSSRFIVRCFGASWAAALDAAGLPVPVGRRGLQRNAKSGGYTREQVLAALQLWLSDARPSRLSFTAYVSWALVKSESSDCPPLPLSAPTIRNHLGSWMAAVAAVRGGAAPVGHRVRQGRSAYEEQALLEHVRRAAEDTGLGEQLSRRAYDEWARCEFRRSPVGAAAHSETVRRRFGGWKRAVTAAGVR